MTITGLPFDFGSGALAEPFPAPRLGQHTDEVLRDVLGMDDAQIAKLKADKIV